VVASVSPALEEVSKRMAKFLMVYRSLESSLALLVLVLGASHAHVIGETPASSVSKDALEAPKEECRKALPEPWELALCPSSVLRLMPLDAVLA
jgi:hypothetical protein